MALAVQTAPSRELAAVGNGDTLYEIVNGQRQEIPHMGFWAGTVATFLAGYLNAFALPRRLGVAVVEVLVRFTPTSNSRRPDITFVSFDRWPVTALPTEDPPELEVVPNLAVEVNSPTNSANEVLDKVYEYFQAGVELVWVIYPRQRCIYVYESPTQNRVLTEKDELDGGQVLPGFRLKVAALFAAGVKPAGRRSGSRAQGGRATRSPKTPKQP